MIVAVNAIYREVTGPNPVEVLNFFQGSLRSCINCVHCDDHFFIFMVFILFASIHHFRNKKGTGAEMSPAIVCGIVLGTRRSAIGRFFCLSLVTIPDVFAKINSTQSTSPFLRDEFLTN